jgi:hypothetical protein
MTPNPRNRSGSATVSDAVSQWRDVDKIPDEAVQLPVKRSGSGGLQLREQRMGGPA